MPADYACSDDLGLSCDSQTMRCTRTTLVAAGASCGPGIGCLASAYCDSTGFCQAPIADGAACSLISSLPCVYPAECVGDVCVVPDPSVCH